MNDIKNDLYGFCIFWEKKSPLNLLLRNLNWNDLWSKMAAIININKKIISTCGNEIVVYDLQKKYPNLVWET